MTSSSGTSPVALLPPVSAPYFASLRCPQAPLPPPAATASALVPAPAQAPSPEQMEEAVA